MPRNCPVGKKDSHACWECIHNNNNECTTQNTITKLIEDTIDNVECFRCIHFKVCARHMGGMNLVRCEDYEEPHIGKWEKFGYKWKCSSCGSKVNIDGTPLENGLLYCSHCGAKMKEE